jgi:hypothetical protein
MKVDRKAGSSRSMNEAERVIRERLLAPNQTLHEQTALHDALRLLQLVFPQESKKQESRGDEGQSCRASCSDTCLGGKISRRKAARNQKNCEGIAEFVGRSESTNDP